MNISLVSKVYHKMLLKGGSGCHNVVALYSLYRPLVHGLMSLTVGLIALQR